MKTLENYYKNIVKYDTINKFFYNNINEIPKLKKISLNFGCRNFDIKKISSSLLSLELITTKKGKLTTAKKANVLLKIRKGYPVGCTVVINKKDMYYFLSKLLIEVFPILKDFKGIKVNRRKTNIKSFSFTIKELITFSNLETNFYLFSNLPHLNITITTNAKNRKELLFLLKSLKFPFIY